MIRINFIINKSNQKSYQLILLFRHWGNLVSLKFQELLLLSGGSFFPEGEVSALHYNRVELCENLAIDFRCVLTTLNSLWE